MKKTFKPTYLIVAALVLSLAPASAHAATVYLESSRSSIAVGDTVVVAVKINAEGAVLNSVDGQVSIDSANAGYSIEEFSLANSIFGLWPRTPSLSADGRSVSFVGGVPGGFSIEGATMFNIVVQATKEGSITISPKDLSVYINDGKGSKATTQAKSLTIQVTAKAAGASVADDWSNIVSTDKAAPSPFIVVAGQDQSLFGGKKFAFFSAVDEQTGIDHYDVSENGGAFVRTGSMYVFQDQIGSPKLSVVAYDKAGNKTVAAYPSAAGENTIHWLTVIVSIAALIALYLIFQMRSKKPENNKDAPTSL